MARNWKYSLFLNGYFYKGYMEYPNENSIEVALRDFRKSKNFEVGDILIQVGRLQDDWYLVECEDCGGSGFSGYGTGYGSVCGNCGGPGEYPICGVGDLGK